MPNELSAIGQDLNFLFRLERLAAAGISEEQLKRLYGPIGLDIGAQSPEEIGVAILAQIIAAKGGKLAAAPERARAVAAAVS